MVAYKYVVCSDTEPSIYDEFEIADEAIAYASEHKDAATYVKKIEVELNDFGEVTQEYGSEIIWSANDELSVQAKDNFMTPEDEEEWLKQMEQEEEDRKYVDPFEADEFGDFYTNRHESLDADKMVEAMEENESEVECKRCFELFPKEDCIKTEHGYLCKECASQHESLENTVEIDLNDDRTPHTETSVEMEEPFVANDMRKHEHAIKDDDSHEFKFFYLEDWDVEPKAESNAEARVTDFFGDLESIEEHVQDRPAPVESEQELQGTDNAVVDCQTDHKVIAHSEDEKPLDCKMKKPALEKPLAGEEVGIKINEDTDIKDLSSQQKNDVITDVAKSLASKDVNTVKAGITREQGGIAYENEKVQNIKKAIFEENLTEELDEKEIPWILQQGEDGEPEFIGWAKSENDLISQMVANHTSDVIYENTYIDELDKDTYEYMKKDGDLSEDEIEELDKYFGIAENLEEAKKDDELPVDPEAAKLEVHTMLNDLVADEIEAINGYEEAKAEIMDTPIAHKDNILDTIDHVEDEEKEHVDELIDATTEIPFDKEEAPAAKEQKVEETPAEEPIDADPFDQEFPEVAETTEEAEVKTESYPDIPFDSEVKEGDKIRIIHLADEDSEYDGKEGTVEHIDSIGQLHGTWGGLAVIPGVDEFEIIANESFNEGVSLDNPSLKKGLGYLSRYPNKNAYVCSYRDMRTHQVVTVDRGFDTYEDLMKYIRAMEAANKNIGSFEVLYSNDLEKYYDALNQKIIK